MPAVCAKFALQVLNQDKKRLLGIAAIRNVVNVIFGTNTNLAMVDRDKHARYTLNYDLRMTSENIQKMRPKRGPKPLCVL